MTIAKCRIKALMEKLGQDKKVELDFDPCGKDYVITAVKMGNVERSKA